MVRPGLRSRSKKRLKRRTPGGRTTVIYRRRRHYVARCAVCGRELSGIPKDPKVIRLGAKTVKRPERAFGGILCPNCLSEAIKLAVRF